MNLALSPQAIAVARLDSKPKVLARMAQLLSEAYGLDESEVLEGLEAREALGSTGFGRGVARCERHGEDAGHFEMEVGAQRQQFATFDHRDWQAFGGTVRRPELGSRGEQFADLLHHIRRYRRTR